MEEYLKGRVELEFYGSGRADILRFLSLAANRGIMIRMAGEYTDRTIRKKHSGRKDRGNRADGACFRCIVSLPDFYRLKDLRRKAGVHYRILRRSGMPFFLRSMRRRIYLPVGIALFFLMLFFLSQFLWNISFEGNLSHTEAELRAFLKEHQVTEGVRTADLSCEEIERLLRNEFFDITWVSCELSGTKLTVHIRETYEKEIAEEEEMPYSLVAEKDAVITSIVTRSGTPLVAAGDEVFAGEELVSGTVTTYDEYGEELFSCDLNADADIYGETVYTYEDAISLRYQEKIYTGKSMKAAFFAVAGYRYTFSLKTLSYESFDRQETTRQLKIGESLYLPLTVGTITCREYTTEEAVYTKEEAREIAEARYLEFLRDLEENVVEIMEKDGTITFGSALCEVHAEVRVIERLGKVVPIDELRDDPANMESP